MIANRRAEWTLALPLGLFFVAFFVGPLALLAIESALSEGQLSASHYVRFLGDRFYLSILWSTLWLGAKATLLCLLFAYPLAWLMTNASPRVRSIILFIVVLPILTSV